jgi:hypothetical protein
MWLRFWINKDFGYVANWSTDLCTYPNGIVVKRTKSCYNLVFKHCDCQINLKGSWWRYNYIRK